MANHLDLEEQEQLDQLKHFWNQYGNLITWILIAVLGSIAAWNGYHMWQRNQATQSAAMYDEVEKVVRSGDVQKAERAFTDMKDRFAKMTYTEQAGLLNWVADNASDPGYASIARLRLAAVMIEAKAYDDALKTLASGIADEFAALAADRKGDIYVLQDKKNEAKAEYQKAFKAFDSQSEYRRLVGVKLSAMGVNAEAGSEKAVSDEGAK